MQACVNGAVNVGIEGVMRSVKAGRITHAFLLTGPAGTGKRDTADYLAKALVCTGDDPPCGECAACRQAAAGSHPDIHRLMSEKRSIGVDLVRDLRAELALRPFEGGRQVVIIEQADRMTPQAQNALLKTLEEPTGDTYFFLITDQPGAMLTTIVSRCRRLRFGPVSLKECADALIKKGIDEDSARKCAAAAHGLTGRAEEIYNDSDYFLLRDDVLTALRTLSGGRAFVSRAASIIEKKKDETRTILEIMENTARDIMARQNGFEPFTDVSGIDIDGRRLLICVLDMRRMLAGNVAWLNIVEKAFLELV